jgi:[ribosomal protein S18]-alanine N-acetyltransferase
VAVERLAFADPWRESDFADAVAAAVPFLVAELDGRVVGYTIGRVAADEGEILNVGVHPESRRRGIARALVRTLLDALGAAGARQVYLEVRESNAAARQLYAALGFGEVGRRARYYRRPVEDAVILRAAVGADGRRA